jgi:hypothetical protein
VRRADGASTPSAKRGAIPFSIAPVTCPKGLNPGKTIAEINKAIGEREE